MSLMVLQQCLKHLEKISAPESWQRALPQIRAEASQFKNILRLNEVPIYGGNTRVGHRDLESLGPEEVQSFQQDLLSSHTLGSKPWYSERTARAIGYAKMYALAAGGTGISEDLFQKVAISTTNPDFRPLIPQFCTYSCGDVIPGAHWAKALLAQHPAYCPGAGEVMALLNGSFVHVGYLLSLVRRLVQLGTLLIETTRINNQVVRANRTNFDAPIQGFARPIVEYLANEIGTTYADYRRQDPISVRATPQIIESFVDTVRSLHAQIDYHLQVPSSNPLFTTDINYPLSQASFLAPALSIKSAAVIEAILFALWASVNRTQYLLSGQIEQIPQDGANSQSALQFIQYPKLMMSMLERCRHVCGRRVFAAGAQTSNGVEDLWTHGVEVAAQLDHLCQAGEQLLITELYVLVKTVLLFKLENQTSMSNAILSAVCESANYQAAAEKLQMIVSTELVDIESQLSDILI